MNFKKEVLPAFFSIALCYPWIANLSAQTASTGAVLGAVTDPSNGAVVGAQVELVNSATGNKGKAVTGSQGQFAFPGVSPGIYTLSASAQGFRTSAITGVDVQVNTNATVNIKLTLGETTSTVSVTASEAQVELQTADATLGDVIGTEPLLKLPTRLRQAQELLLLQPGTPPRPAAIMGRRSRER